MSLSPEAITEAQERAVARARLLRAARRYKRENQEGQAQTPTEGQVQTPTEDEPDQDVNMIGGRKTRRKTRKTRRKTRKTRRKTRKTRRGGSSCSKKSGKKCPYYKKRGFHKM